jgi:hypothetical protein
MRFSSSACSAIRERCVRKQYPILRSSAKMPQ